MRRRLAIAASSNIEVVADYCGGTRPAGRNNRIKQTNEPIPVIDERIKFESSSENTHKNNEAKKPMPRSSRRLEVFDPGGAGKGAIDRGRSGSGSSPITNDSPVDEGFFSDVAERSQR
jgi:hypothetical protein